MAINLKELKHPLAEHTRSWYNRPFRTTPADPEIMARAYQQLYAAVNLQPPVFALVPSPLVTVVAGGFAAGIWRRMYGINGATREDTRKAIQAAISAVTSAAAESNFSAASLVAKSDVKCFPVNSVISPSPCRAVEVAVDKSYSVIEGLYDSGTLEAVFAATEYKDHISSADLGATQSVICQAVDVALLPNGWAGAVARTISQGDEFLLSLMFSCCKSWTISRYGAGLYSRWICYLSAFPDVLSARKIPVLQAAIDAGIDAGSNLQWMHPEFCIVSDFPETVNLFTVNRTWRDGFKI
ncbi:MAG: hypothetical protein HY986_02380 [Candidatus Melainabacteria bacterium]|nr:hypothetical protein [Candidatus Melainabacteria bacterium]